jgi:Transposase DNA-binding/Transposase Tn5 dimerisation domain
MEQEIARWAQATWGECELGNAQRTRRAVAIGMRMAAHPGAGLPEQMGSKAMLKGAYRLLNCPAVEIEGLWQPPQEATRRAAGQCKTVLFIQDWTTLDYSHHPQKTGIGPVGSRQQRGMLLHSVLAYAFEEKQILGLAYGQVIVREEADAGTTKKHNGGRRSQGIEGRVWEQAAEAIGPAPRTSRWIHVSDRESDVFEYMAVCKSLGKDFVIRAFHNRKVDESDDAAEASAQGRRYLMELARKLVPQTEQTYTVEVPATIKKGVKQPKRRAQIRLVWTQIHMPAPSYVKGHPGLEVWIVRAGEPDPPVGAEAVEWILITSLAVDDWDNARYLTQIYECRWLVEDYHMCLKTGCRMEDSQLDHGDDLKRLLGFIAPIAVRLMQLRQVVRAAPETPATTAATLDPLMVRLLAAKFKLAVSSLTVKMFWTLVAQLGGYLGRTSDGPPGWRTLWKGWRHLSEWADGVRLLTPAKSG